jgi:RNA polymerase sigma-70 factor (ECF subfamily)
MADVHVELGSIPAAGQDHSAFVRLANDDASVLDEILRCNWPPLLAYVKSLIGDRDEAEDIAQEAFVYLWSGRKRWIPDGSVRALLYRAARTRSLNTVRHDRVSARSSSLLEVLAREQHWTPTPLQLLEHAELRSAIHEAIETLPPRRREVFLLGYLHGCRHAEIADIMHISEQTARNHMSAALSDLRRILEPFLE